MSTFARFVYYCVTAGLSVLAGCGGVSSPPQQYRIASSSMFPAFMGPGRSAICNYCLRPLVVAAETISADYPTRCYACGGMCQIGDELLPGDEVQILPLDTDCPRRFDVIAFSIPGDETCRVKRVWGLPGERPGIRDGELWIDGQPFRKTLDQFEQVCVPLSRFPGPRPSHWFIHRNGLETHQPVEQFKATTFELIDGDSLYWDYLSPAPVHPEVHLPKNWLLKSDLCDDYECNQGLSYQTQTVEDYLLRIEFDSPCIGALALSCTYRNKSFCLNVRVDPKFDTNPTGSHSTGSQELRPEDGETEKTIRTGCTSRLAMAFCDGRVWLRVDGKLRSWLWEALADELPATTAQNKITLKCITGQIGIRQLSVDRDLYLRTSGRDGAGVQQFEQLSADSYFVIGDNAPASVDSRNGLGFVSRKQIRGKVVMPNPASR